MLAIAIQRKRPSEALCAGAIKARSQRHALAEIGPVRNHLRASSGSLGSRFIRRTVIHHEHGLEMRQRARNHVANRSRFVQTGNDCGANGRPVFDSRRSHKAQRLIDAVDVQIGADHLPVLGGNDNFTDVCVVQWVLQLGRPELNLPNEPGVTALQPQLRRLQRERLQ